MRNTLFVLVLLSAVLVSSCNNTYIEGKIVDGFGKPVPEATVNVEGTDFVSQTNGKGHYRITYVPGDVHVVVSKEGFANSSFTTSILKEMRVDAGPTILYEIPPAEEVFLMHKGRYVELRKGVLHSSKQDVSDSWHYREQYVYSVTYNPEDITAIQKTEEDVVLFDHCPGSVTLVKVMNPGTTGGTLLVRTVDNGARGFAAGDFTETRMFMEGEVVELDAPNCKLRYYTLDAGDYAIVQYNRHSLTAISGPVYLFKVID
ncbi:MAG: carboxypeptidase-like regulatory domain-containing protein [Bacteroidales bacterium]|jgi:predicted small secreted protein|nr:carboxypeptidase-like regulatory domain-containing protein [Bacteroidales bacterium]